MNSMPPPVNHTPFCLRHTIPKIISIILFLIPVALSFFVWIASSDTHETKDYIEDLEHFAAFNAYTVYICPLFIKFIILFR